MRESFFEMLFCIAQRGDSPELQRRLLELTEELDTIKQEKESVEKSLLTEIKELKEQVSLSGI